MTDKSVKKMTTREFHAKHGYILPQIEGFNPDLTFLPNGWAVSIIEIDPDLALKFLQTVPDNQRKLIPIQIERYTNAIMEDDWHLTHQGIAFNVNGKLHDGQNRMAAVHRTNKTVRFIVFFGAGGDVEMSVTDKGRSRSAVDTLAVMRMKTSKNIISTIKNAVYAGNVGKGGAKELTDSRLVRIVEKYGNCAELVETWYSRCRVPGIDRAPVRGATLAAMGCGVSDSVLERFVGVFTDQMPATEKADTAPHKLRLFMQNTRERFSGTMNSIDLYKRSCTAIRYAEEGFDCKLLRPDDNVYLLRVDDL